MNEALNTRGYIPRSTEGQEFNVILTAPIQQMGHTELVGRDQAEDYVARLEEQLADVLKQVVSLGHDNAALRDSMADLKDEHDERGIDIDVLKQQNEQLAKSLKAERELSEQALREGGELLSQLSDICLAVGKCLPQIGVPVTSQARDIVVAAYKPSNRFLRAIRMLVKGF